MKLSWINFLILVQLLYALTLLGLPIYLLSRGDGWGVIFVSAAMGCPGILALIGWFGLRRRKRWGWSLVLSADLVVLGILTYALVDEGWHKIDWGLLGIAVIAAIITAALFIPPLPRWRRQSSSSTLSS